MSMLKPGEKVKKLPDSYVIFLTETDVIGLDEPIYLIDRYFKAKGKHIRVNDGSHIVYVNGAKRGKRTKLEKLMHDFFCTRADDMNYKQLAKTMRYYKESEKGVLIVSSVVDEWIMSDRIKNALKMIKDGKLSLEDIARYSNLPLKKVRELSKEQSA